MFSDGGIYGGLIQHLRGAVRIDVEELLLSWLCGFISCRLHPAMRTLPNYLSVQTSALIQSRCASCKREALLVSPILWNWAVVFSWEGAIGRCEWDMNSLSRVWRRQPINPENHESSSSRSQSEPHHVDVESALIPPSENVDQLHCR